MPEVWLTGPIDGVPPLLMPAAHTFQQVRDEIRELLTDASREQIWGRIGGSAPIGFHAAHLAGATDRLLTYARGEALSDTQLATMNAESHDERSDAAQLIALVESAMDAALEQIRRTLEDEVFVPREVGRKRLPSTTLGLINHAAEHALRHAGQIVTLKKVLAR